jgi:hypothetical protein
MDEDVGERLRHVRSREGDATLSGNAVKHFETARTGVYMIWRT